jgi:hypothetical protein
MTLAVLALCDAVEDGATNADARIAAVTKARKYAHRVIDRANKRQDDTPETPAEGTES